ncbi:MAG TPA: hypothetical protein VLR27_17530 [Acidimicrobiales bacterium]|nr:hypothetical protein [Acidimicrobiales bacterium]
MTSVAGQLLRHPVQRRLCAPAAATAAGASVVLALLAELRAQAVPDAVQLAALVLALATVTAATDPVGVLADASPTPGGRRLAVRAGPVLTTVAAGWLLAIAALPSALRPPVSVGSATLAALVALVVAGGVLEARRRPRATEPLTAAAAVAMGWTALWLLRPSWSPLLGTDPWASVLIAAVGAVAAVRIASPG